jgi:hypothetical protein
MVTTEAVVVKVVKTVVTTIIGSERELTKYAIKHGYSRL